MYDLALQPGETGDKARAIWLAFGDALGIALATLINAFNFPLYLLSGGVLAAWDLFQPRMMETIERRSFTYRVTKCEMQVAAATLGSEAGLYGAAYLPWLET